MNEDKLAPKRNGLTLKRNKNSVSTRTHHPPPIFWQDTALQSKLKPYSGVFKFVRAASKAARPRGAVARTKEQAVWAGPAPEHWAPGP